MHSAGYKHQAKRDGDRAGAGKQARTQNLEGGDACERAEKVTAEQSTWLSRRRSGKAEQKDRASSKRGQNEGGMRRTSQEESDRDCARGADQTPGQPGERVTVHVPTSAKLTGRTEPARLNVLLD